MKIKNIIILSLLLRGIVPMVADAQPLNASRPEFILQVAEEKFDAKDYVNALDFYNKYYEATKDRSVLYKMGLADMYLSDYVKAESNFSRSLQRTKSSTVEVPEDARFYLGITQKMNEKYDEAIVSLEEYMKEAKNPVNAARAKTDLDGAKLAMRMKENVKLTVENLGTKVNSPNSEYSPAFSGGALYFAALRDGKITIIDGKEGDYYAKIYKTTANDKGEFRITNLGTGNYMIVAVNDKNGNYKCDSPQEEAISLSKTISPDTNEVLLNYFNEIDKLIV